MNDSLEALIELNRAGTMAAAANRLRLTPSAISKRIAFLEEQTGYAVIEKDGRQVKLTPAGRKLVARVEPLLTDLRLALADQPEAIAGEISIGVSESVLASWGAALLTKTVSLVPGVRLKIGSHRSPVVIERVLAGEYALGLCAGASQRHPDLIVDSLGEEPLVLIPSGMKPFRLSSGKTLEVLSIEPHAATWQSLRPQLRTLANQRGINIQVKDTLQSFSAVVQLAKAGYAHGLAPDGLVRAMGVSKDKYISIPSPGLTRPIGLIGRSSTLARPSVRAFVETLHSVRRKELGARSV